MSPTQRTLAYWRKNGIAAVVERFNRFANVRQDLFGFADVIACHPLWAGTVYIQTTTGSDMHRRIRKIRSEKKIREAVARLLGAGNSVVVEGWAERKKNKRVVKYERRAFRCEMEGTNLMFREGA